MGTLKGFDQLNNLVLEQAFEERGIKTLYIIIL
jgi:small nuclear ribonucleoprotein (snRNP)-like protein